MASINEAFSRDMVAAPPKHKSWGPPQTIAISFEVVLTDQLKTAFA